MKPEALTFETVGDRGRKSDYLSRAGWGVFPDDPHAGDRIELSDYWDNCDEAVLKVATGNRVCEFCNDETHVAERGVIAADYLLADPDDHDEVQAATCHSCISGNPVVARAVVDYDAGDVYTRREHFDGPFKATLPEGQDGITHPHDREGEA